MTSRGEQLADLAYPLFPAPMNELNFKIIRARRREAANVTGAGEAPVGEYYKKVEGDVLQGGGYITVCDPQGVQIGVGDLADPQKQLNNFCLLKTRYT
jgi:hypothetical protein